MVAQIAHVWTVFQVTHDLDDRLQKECETEITILQMLDHPNLLLGLKRLTCPRNAGRVLLVTSSPVVRT